MSHFINKIHILKEKLETVFDCESIEWMSASTKMDVSDMQTLKLLEFGLFTFNKSMLW